MRNKVGRRRRSADESGASVLGVEMGLRGANGLGWTAEGVSSQQNATLMVGRQ